MPCCDLSLLRMKIPALSIAVYASSGKISSGNYDNIKIVFFNVYCMYVLINIFTFINTLIYFFVGR